MKFFSGMQLAFLCLLLVPAAAQSQVAITSGSASTFWVSPPGFGYRPEYVISLAGAGFSLTSNLLLTTPPSAVATVSGAQAQVTFYPSQTVTPVATVPGSPGTVTYNGQNYVLASLTMQFSGAPVALNTQTYTPQQTVSNVPFTMTGSVAVCPVAVPSCGASSQSTITISGSGVYSGGLFNLARSQLFGSSQNPIYGNGDYQFTPPSGFVLDTTTQGNWNGTYGLDGYLIANGGTYLPSYAAVGFMPDDPFTWVGPGQISDVRAPQSAACPVLLGFGSPYLPFACPFPDRIASAYTWYGTNSLNISITFTDNQVHRVALYLLDWDSFGRQETVSIQQNGQPFDTQTFSNFNAGQYGAWNLQGNVLITVKPVGAASATNPGSPVVSGIFFGPGTSNSVPTLPTNVRSTASLLPNLNGTSAQPQGAWTGVYGTKGYLIANGPSQAPTYGTVKQTGGTTYTWASATNDPRALQTSPGSTTGIASAFTQYGAQPLTFNVNITDASPHQVSLYLLDWDSSGRQETITIQDAATGAILLAGATYSGFQNGVYYSWFISGNVTITVTPVGPASPTNPDTAVVSGIFFDN